MFFSVVVFSVLVLVGDVVKDKSLPTVIKGQLDLSKIDFYQTKSVPLDGDWSFYWQELRKPQDINEENSSIDFFKVPSTWNTQKHRGKDLALHGAATYQAEVTLNKQYERLAIRIPSIGTAYQLYIDDQLLAEGGKVAFDAKDSIAKYHPGIFDFSPQSETFTITVLVSNHQFQWGGFWESLRVGLPSELFKQQYAKGFRNSFLIAVFITVCIFNLIQFSLNPTNRLPLLVALISASLAIRELEASQILQFSDIYYWNFEAGVRISFLTFAATTPIYMLYFYYMFPKDYYRSVMIFINAVAITYSLIILLTPSLLFSTFMPYFQVFMIPALLFLMSGIILAVIRKRPNANLLFVGSMMLFTCVVNDILHSMNVIDTLILSSFGLVAFLMCQNYLTYTYFINAGIENKVLDVRLKERNEKLEELSSTLEHQVIQRTSELARANQKLEVLVNEDPLTCLLNRRGLMQHINQAKQEFDVFQRPFCLVLIDFDHFKKLNDQLGHDVGDIVLETGGIIMKGMVKEHGFAGRWGGEEFLVLLTDCEIKEGKKIAEDIREQIYFDLTSQIKHSITITLGITQCRNGDTIDMCLKRTDLALYEGKKLGRNRVISA
ncbi:diguanylate cyclase [Glaciecola sp. KUL10]|uniref:sensor domain-containing diguanylate cyclase n=1 Tax=Glaciecola sp. (strain KUL10) TaxID=2161813 RepID=UPI000D789206|nr:diguanylate cyclase [Glaciecola sp. KUL10]GBL04290.1 hypothetical protein KUL10_15960 [Glaciecola sp. KUL10]